MKITLQHLGPIEQAEIDLRPLTVFIGRNNTGKTWATQAIGAMFGSTMHEAYTYAYIDERIPDAYLLIDQLVEQIIQNGNAQLDWDDWVKQFGEIFLTNLMTFSKNTLNEFMGTELVNFEPFQMNLDFDEVIPILLSEIIGAKITTTMSKILSVATEQGSSKLYFFTGIEENILDRLPKREIKYFIVMIIFLLIRIAFWRKVYFFPTERTTMINLSSYLRGEVRVGEAHNLTNSSNHKISAYISLFADMLSNALGTNLNDRHNQANSNPKIATYLDLANLLETEILGGQIGIATSKLGLKNEWIFQTNGVNLEIPVSSSMTKELAPLVLYLRYLAQPGELIIIDEPEMNLHPQAQAELMEFLAMLVNAGLHVLITTHSPYMVDHLVNLMAAAKHEDKTAIKEHFLLERTESFISQDKVSVYLFENGTATNVVDDKGIIHWGTFGEVSNYLSDIYARLI